MDGWMDGRSKVPNVGISRTVHEYGHVDDDGILATQKCRVSGSQEQFTNIGMVMVILKRFKNAECQDRENSAHI